MTDTPPLQGKQHYLFSSREQCWILVGFAVINLLASLKNFFFRSAPEHFAALEYYAHGMAALSAVVLSYWIYKSKSGMERCFVSLWLLGWALVWFGGAYSPSTLRVVQLVVVLVWSAASVIAVRITRRATAEEQP